MDRSLYTKPLRLQSPISSTNHLSIYGIIFICLHCTKPALAFSEFLVFRKEKRLGKKIYHAKVISISAASLCLGRSQSQVVRERGGYTQHREPQIRVSKWRLGLVLLKGCQPLLSCLFYIDSHAQRKSERATC